MSIKSQPSRQGTGRKGQSGVNQNVKQDILDTALRLFNERGYNAVSMRAIAQALGISVGNLTYHYKRKEDLVEALVAQRHQHYKKPQAPQSLMALHETFVRLLRHHAENAYYFRHYTQFAQVSEQVRKQQRDVTKDFHAMVLGCFATLRKSGLMQPELQPGQDQCTAGTLMMLTVQDTLRYTGPVAHTEENTRLLCLWSVLLPLLTGAGKGQYTREIQPLLAA